MKNLDTKKLILIKKLIGLGCGVLSLLLMFLNFIKYTSSSSIKSGSAITWHDQTSLFTFLFNGKSALLDSKVYILRDIFSFSHVVMWVSFIICLISIAILIVGVFSKKGLISKIGSYALSTSILLLIIIRFKPYTSGNTIKYLDCFTPIYLLILLISFVGLFATSTLEDKKDQ